MAKDTHNATVFLILVFLCSISNANANIVINEIMYNPSGNEYAFEYIELYGGGDVSGWYFEGIDFEFPNNTTISDHTIIANTLTKEGNQNDFFDRYGNKTAQFEYSGTLLNSGETIVLRDNESNIVDIVTYDDWAEENRSLERIEIEGYSSNPHNWEQSVWGGTPGKLNSVSKQNGCDWKVDIITESQTGFDPTWKIKAERVQGGGKVNLTIDHWVEDSYGETIKGYQPIIVKNAVTKKTSSTYSPTLKTSEGYFVRANISNITCSDTNAENNFAKTLFFVQQEGQEDVGDSVITIVSDDDDDTVQFGDIVKQKMHLYRGDTRKYSISMYVEGYGKKVSEKSTIHLKTKYVNTTLTLPIQLKPNCNKKYKDGDYEIVVEGLGIEKRQDIEIEGNKDSYCQKSLQKEEQAPKQKFEFSIKEYKQAFVGEPFDVTIELIGDEKKHSFELWGYVYRGKKTYSKERDENKIDFELEPFEKKEVVLSTTLIEQMNNGDYKLKVLINKDDQKTNKELIQEIIVKKRNAKISNFYFEKLDEPLLVINVDSSNAESVELISEFGEEKNDLFGNSTNFSAQLGQGKNLFFAKLLDEEGEVIDVSSLTIEERGDFEKRSETFQDSKDPFEKVEDFKNRRGIVVYESASLRARDMAPWLFMCALVILSILLVLKKI